MWKYKQMLNDWEILLVISLYKQENASNFRNYSGITLQSKISKLYANILRIKLNKYIEEILCEERCGFRTRRG